MRAQQLPVVRREHDHGVVGATLGHGRPNGVDGGVDLGVQPVVELAVLVGARVVDVGRQWCVTGGIRGTERGLGSGLGREVLVGGRWRRHARHIVRGAGERVVASPQREQHDVVRVDEARHEQERSQCRRVTRSPPGVTIGEPFDHASGRERVSPQPAVGERAAVRFGTDPAGEPERIEPVGISIASDRCMIDDAVVVIGGQRTPGRVIVQIGMGEVPLALVTRVVAGDAEPVAQGRHLAWTEPPHGRVVGILAEPVRLRDPVHVGILTGEQRRPARNACQRTGVVAFEADAVLGEPASTR